MAEITNKNPFGYDKKNMKTNSNKSQKGIIFALEQSRDCFGYKEHKVHTTNLIYKYDLEKDRKLFDFAQGCYENGWLQALEVAKSAIQLKLKERKAELEKEIEICPVKYEGCDCLFCIEQKARLAQLKEDAEIIGVEI
jgi:hypothetical protein